MQGSRFLWTDETKVDLSDGKGKLETKRNCPRIKVTPSFHYLVLILGF